MWYSKFVFPRFEMKQTSCIWQILMFLNIWNHPENILFTFFDIFGLILCYFLCKNWFETLILAFWITLVNACWPHVWYDQIHFGGLYVSISSSFPLNITSRNAKLILGGRKNHFFLSTSGWWNNNLHFFFLKRIFTSQKVEN